MRLTYRFNGSMLSVYLILKVGYQWGGLPPLTQPMHVRFLRGRVLWKKTEGSQWGPHEYWLVVTPENNRLLLQMLRHHGCDLVAAVTQVQGWSLVDQHIYTRHRSRRVDEESLLLSFYEGLFLQLSLRDERYATVLPDVPTRVLQQVLAECETLCLDPDVHQTFAWQRAREWLLSQENHD